MRLVISVDTGIRAFAAADEAARLNLDLIVTDHHLPEAAMGLPKALAILNPNQPDCAYPCKHLCGAGVAFKLAQALLEAVDPQRAREKLLPSFLKMLVLATVADAVPLLGENRVIASLGIAELRRPVNPGLRALLDSCSTGPREAWFDSIRHRLPHRPAHQRRRPHGYRFRCRRALHHTRHRPRTRAGNEARSAQLRTPRRRGRSSSPRSTPCSAAGTIDQLGCLVIDGEGWHRGVLGILASRVVERTGRPALVLSHEDGEAHGSGRSIPGFHLLEALESCHDVFVRFGGHAHAVGFSLTSARVPELRDRLQQHAAIRLTPQILERKLDCSAELPLHQIDIAFYQALRLLEPYGMGNEEPVFIARNLTLESAPQIMKDQHIRLHLRDDETVMKALGWRWAERVRVLGLDQGSRIDLAYRLRMNEHPDFGGLELEIVDLKSSDSGFSRQFSAF